MRQGASLPEAHVIQGDMLLELPKMAADSFDSCVCDPPYGLTNRVPDVFKCLQCHRVLGGRDGTASECPRCGGELSRQRSGTHQSGFMGHSWDGTGVAFDPEAWREVYRVLKPGGFLVAMGGTRTYHRLATAIEDAGFEMRDSIAEWYDASDSARAFLESLTPEQMEMLARALPGDGYLAWSYGSGFPKSMDVSKAIDKAAGAQREVVGRYQPPNGQQWNLSADDSTPGAGGTMGRFGSRSESLNITAPATEAAKQWEGWGTALKPSFEPIVLARKPLGKRNVAENVLEYGTGALNIDATRIATDSRPLRELDPKPEANGPVFMGRREAGHGFDGGSKAVGETSLGRWPANCVLIHSEGCRQVGQTEVKGRVINRWTDGAKPFGGGAGHPYSTEQFAETDTVGVWACVETCPVRLLDEQSGPAGGTTTPVYSRDSGADRTGNTSAAYGAESRPAGTEHPWYPDSGGASRFFYTSKASRSERNERVHGEEQPMNWSSGEQSPGTFQSPNTHRAANNHHPTVKPIDLMRWLCRLVTPPGGKVLDCFAGSGSTLVAALYEGFDAVGIEQQPEYVRIARQRIDGAQMGFVWDAPHADPEEAVVEESMGDAARVEPEQIGLFG